MYSILKSKSTRLLSALLAVLMIVAMLPTTAFAWSVEEGTKCTSTRIISLKVNNSDISRLRDARDTIAVGQQGQVLYLLVEP